MFATPYLPGGRRALAVFDLPHHLRILNLDDPTVLHTLGLRPSQVVIRDPAVTQPLALRLFRTLNSDGVRQWDGLSWWSFQRPHWTNVAIWAPPSSPCPLTLLTIEHLALDHPAVAEASLALARPIITG
jgi:hypothetical protein